MKHFLNTDNIIIRIAAIDEIVDLIDHEVSHMQDLGYNNLPAHPFYPTHDFNRDPERKKNQFSKNVKETGWGRTFIAIDNGKIIGHLNIKNELETALHRARLGMGIDKEYRGRSIGKKLIASCIEFCRANQIEYIDLSVFSHNIPARKLYQSFGFKEIGIIQDLFRMNNYSIDDVIMVLKL